MGRLIEMDHDAVALDDDHLITMGAYIRLFAELSQGPISTPTLMVRAREGAGANLKPEEQILWQGVEQTVEVPGDHFAVIGEGAEATAEAVDSWLSARLELEPSGQQ
jgi:hypothetical protein